MSVVPLNRTTNTTMLATVVTLRLMSETACRLQCYCKSSLPFPVRAVMLAQTQPTPCVQHIMHSTTTSPAIWRVKHVYGIYYIGCIIWMLRCFVNCASVSAECGGCRMHLLSVCVYVCKTFPDNRYGCVRQA